MIFYIIKSPVLDKFVIIILMISYLKGVVIKKDLNYAILDVNGVGYKIFLSNFNLDEINDGDKIGFWTHLAVRENAMDLYGFKEAEEKNLFELFLTINGIGPKSAMTIMNTASTKTLYDGIKSKDPNYLAKISGLGKKTAEKIIINLKDEDVFNQETQISDNNHGSTAIDALVSLGYSEKDARQAINDVEKSDNPEKMIREALKKLSNK